MSAIRISNEITKGFTDKEYLNKNESNFEILLLIQMNVFLYYIGPFINKINHGIKKKTQLFSQHFFST